VHHAAALGPRDSTGSPGLLPMVGTASCLPAKAVLSTQWHKVGACGRCCCSAAWTQRGVHGEKAAEDLKDGAFCMRGRGVCIATAALALPLRLLPEHRLTPELSRAAKRLRLE